ncbi:hypothetical protein [Edaphocola flava]|uniref:hypothetical protein n=1 Tax=Edaphocola flava TaxID=2499629 RepID=UPI00100B6118|nr:hypothetical protein [Edaphocola flava]
MNERYKIIESGQYFEIEPDSKDRFSFAVGILELFAITWFVISNNVLSSFYAPVGVIACFAIFKVHIYNTFERLYTRTLIKQGDTVCLLLGRKKYILDRQQCYISWQSEKSTYLSNIPPRGFIIELHFTKRFGYQALFKKSIMLFYTEEVEVCKRKLEILQEHFGLRDAWDERKRQLQRQKERIRERVNIIKTYTDMEYTVETKTGFRFALLTFLWSIGCGILCLYFYDKNTILMLLTALIWLYAMIVNWFQCLVTKKIIRIGGVVEVYIGKLRFIYEIAELRLVLTDRHIRNVGVVYTLQLKKYGAFYPLSLFGKIILYADVAYVDIRTEIPIIERVAGVECIELLLHEKEN